MSEKSTNTLPPLVGSESDRSMDVYLRMNEDAERDYCFNVLSTAPLASLRHIFETLPMVLSPSYFYDSVPMGYAVSTHPGFLTGEGGLLFTADSHRERHLKKVSQDTKFIDAVWEGQLIVPVWRYNYSRLLTVLTLLGAWLYMDLPDYVSPTPGLAPTTLIYNLVVHFFPIMRDDTPSGFESHTWQWVFFGLHFVKCAFIYMILWVGGVNPVSFNPIKARKAKNKEVTRETLLSVGWTSSRRATPSEWRDENRKAKIESAGGIVKAYHQGILDGLGTTGVYLGTGEGWDSKSPVSNKLRQGAFLVDDNYFKDIYTGLGTRLANAADDAEKAQIVRKFRRNGPEQASEKLSNAYLERKAIGDGDIKPGTEDADKTD